MKNNIGKHLSFFTLFRTHTIESFTNFSHFDSLWQMIWLVINNAHIFEHRLKSKGGFIDAIELSIIANLRKETFVSNFNSSIKCEMQTLLAPTFSCEIMLSKCQVVLRNFFQLLVESKIGDNLLWKEALFQSILENPTQSTCNNASFVLHITTSI